MTEVATTTSAASVPLLKAGVLVCPVFVLTTLVLAIISPGFDLSKHQVSLLLLADVGWLQTANFIATGLLGIGCAVGVRLALRSGRAGTWGPILLAAFGVMFIVAGLFHPDPQLGFPDSAPSGMPAAPSTPAGIHSFAFMVLALAIVAAGFVFARLHRATHPRWAIYDIASSVTILVLVALGGALTKGGHGGLPLFGVALAISLWVSATAIRTLADVDRREGAREQRTG